ncbi:N-formylglutamate amidohydrolase [Gluconacetobacter azotocaptans]|uniref:N-formylglutamate amidohydrolase n=1 Tax=Gluconacetobacter azotocaptans TaxID=142834 RepID=A0A7W4JVD6_9PROT|nr:N-formylglutamate amidohydrolase [Gluconacetobacter azotocaptans]MBB2191603.1 N-formylglutamate amidohydrolase [Gluconacetobacter azotocaptans]GBQ32952.1 N-formylglutamate amidohydrolase [Gluconacetobacter azotocaptans DSM 13594]
MVASSRLDHTDATPLNDGDDAHPAPFVVTAPRAAPLPLVIASPHSGRAYPDAFLAMSRLDRAILRRSEDFHVDELLNRVPDLGASLICATFPRIYCDPNREAWELDPTMFSEPLPDGCNSTTARVRAGLGTIPRLSATGVPIYRTRLPFAEACERIRTCWAPYHAALSALIDAAVAAHGVCLLVDCHSMPGPTGRNAPDFILGDAWGTSCAPAITAAAETALRARGFGTCRNTPYAGGYVTRHYGRPRDGVHTLQVEISRALYMDEARLEKGDGFALIRAMLTGLLRDLAAATERLTRDRATALSS